MANTRFHDNGNGTITDRQTNLMWEKKAGTTSLPVSYCPGGPTWSSVHHVQNLYAWSVGTPYGLDGSMASRFLAELNGVSPFAGYQDWRLPTIQELSSILDLTAFDCYSHNPPGCIDPIFGLNRAGAYLTSTSDHTDPASTWTVDFSGEESQPSEGFPYTVHKVTDSHFVRAVRSVK